MSLRWTRDKIISSHSFTVVYLFPPRNIANLYVQCGTEKSTLHWARILSRHFETRDTSMTTKPSKMAALLSCTIVLGFSLKVTRLRPPTWRTAPWTLPKHPNWSQNTKSMDLEMTKCSRAIWWENFLATGHVAIQGKHCFILFLPGSFLPSGVKDHAFTGERTHDYSVQ